MEYYQLRSEYCSNLCTRLFWCESPIYLSYSVKDFLTCMFQYKNTLEFCDVYNFVKNVTNSSKIVDDIIYVSYIPTYTFSNIKYTKESPTSYKIKLDDFFDYFSQPHNTNIPFRYSTIFTLHTLRTFQLEKRKNVIDVDKSSTKCIRFIQRGDDFYSDDIAKSNYYRANSVKSALKYMFTREDCIDDFFKKYFFSIIEPKYTSWKIDENSVHITTNDKHCVEIKLDYFISKISHSLPYSSGYYCTYVKEFPIYIAKSKELQKWESRRYIFYMLYSLSNKFNRKKIVSKSNF